MNKSTPSSKTCNVRMCLVAVSRLMVDHTYQRNALSQRNINEIVKNYAVESFGTLNVAERNGVYYVVDGQHRLAAAKKLGLAVVPCAIWVSRGVEQEAMEFERCNSARKSVDCYTKYRAMVVAKDADHLLCEEILSRQGLRIAQGNTSNNIAFPSTAMATLKSSRQLFEYCLRVQRQMVGKDTNLGEQIHKGLFYAFSRIQKPQYPMDDLSKKVYALGGKTALMHEIRRLHLESGTREGCNRMYAMAVVNVLNKAIGRGKKIIFGEAA